VTEAERLRDYARLTVRVGANVQPGQPVAVRALIEHAPFVRVLAEEAWKAGASYVDVRYVDQHLKRVLIEHAPEEALTHTPEWLLKLYEDLAAAQGAEIVVSGDPDPEVLAGLDPSKVGLTRMNALAELSMRQIDARTVSWTIVAVPNEGWARTVFGEPDVERLWGAVAAAVRLDDPDPVEAWRSHTAKLARRARALNELHLDAVRFNGPGTDLTVGLLEDSRWCGDSHTAWGVEHVANMPTEEVFTTPDRRRTEGSVRSTRPLALPSQGLIVRDLQIEFDSGRVTRVDASENAEVVRAQMESDDGASFLGEVALVDGESAVGKTGITFFDTLFDENATCHVAYGCGFASAVEGAVGLDPAELMSRGVNHSVVHVDFMVGGPEVDVDGVAADGAVIPLLRDDVWQLDK
jgi:aminopeptidase